MIRVRWSKRKHGKGRRCPPSSGEFTGTSRMSRLISTASPRCPFRKSYPDIMVMQPGQDWDRDTDPGFEMLFDGTSVGDWTMSTIRNQPGRDDPGGFLVRRGVLESRSGIDLGLLWLNRPTPRRYVLRLQ
jgi:hypothetical protein